MNLHDPFFDVPPITEVPEYVWSPRYDKPSFVPGRPVKKTEVAGRRLIHSDAESALLAAKRATRGKVGRWYGRTVACGIATEFLVYENNKVIERHVVRCE